MKNGVPATAPSIRAACADRVRRSSAILTRGASGFVLTFASAHSREGSARCSAAYNAMRSVTCSGSRYPRRTNWRVPLQARESLPRERSSTRSGVAMAPLAGARRGFESAALRALDGRDRDRHRDGGEECDTDKHDDRRDHAPRSWGSISLGRQAFEERGEGALEAQDPEPAVVPGRLDPVALWAV